MNSLLEPQRTRYVMAKKKNEEFEYNPKQTEYSFYQICGYPQDGFFHSRKIIYNEQLKPISVYEKMYPKKKIQKFMERTTTNKYQVYPTVNLKLVDYPNPNQIIAANSSLLI